MTSKNLLGVRASLWAILICAVLQALPAHSQNRSHVTENIGVTVVSGPSLEATDEISNSPYTISRHDASWLRVSFSDWDLPDESTLEIYSPSDGATQVFTEKTLSAWSGRSAYFNGSELRLTINTQRWS